MLCLETLWGFNSSPVQSLMSDPLASTRASLHLVNLYKRLCSFNQQTFGPPASDLMKSRWARHVSKSHREMAEEPRNHKMVEAISTNGRPDGEVKLGILLGLRALDRTQNMMLPEEMEPLSLKHCGKTDGKNHRAS